MGLEAGVAQSVEQLIRNEKVEGSIPFSGTNKINDLGHLTRVAFFFDLTPLLLRWKSAVVPIQEAHHNRLTALSRIQAHRGAARAAQELMPRATMDSSLLNSLRRR